MISFLATFPEGHRFLQNGDPKHTSNDTRLFMLLNGINNQPMPAESSDLNPIEMVWNDIKYYLGIKVQPKTKDELITGITTFWICKRDD